MTIKVYLDVYITITMEKVFPVWHVMPVFSVLRHDVYIHSMLCNIHAH